MINRPWKKHILMAQKPKFSQLCSALDVLGDSELAINSFTASAQKNTKDEYGKLYLETYGLLQSLFIQQDAVCHIYESLDVDIEKLDCPKLINIRNIRNSSIGHPSKKDRPKPTTYNHIVRPSLSRNGFELMTYSTSGLEHKNVNFDKLIKTQRAQICSILAKIIHELENEYQEHKKKFEGEHLSKCFPPILGYAFEKAHESLSQSHRNLGTWSIKSIEQSIQCFRDCLKEREPQALNDLEHDIKLIKRAIEAFKEILEDTEEPIDGYIYLEFLREKVRSFQEMATYWDDEYNLELKTLV